MSDLPKSVHPAQCACTSCIIGHSLPADQADLRVVDGIVDGVVRDETGIDERRFDKWLDHLVLGGSPIDPWKVQLITGW